MKGKRVDPKFVEFRRCFVVVVIVILLVVNPCSKLTLPRGSSSTGRGGMLARVPGRIVPHRRWWAGLPGTIASGCGAAIGDWCWRAREHARVRSAVHCARVQAVMRLVVMQDCEQGAQRCPSASSSAPTTFPAASSQLRAGMSGQGRREPAKEACRRRRDLRPRRGPGGGRRSSAKHARGQWSCTISTYWFSLARKSGLRCLRAAPTAFPFVER